MGSWTTNHNCRHWAFVYQHTSYALLGGGGVGATASSVLEAVRYNVAGCATLLYVHEHVRRGLIACFETKQA